MKLQVWCCTSMILALARGRQDGCEFYASLGKIARPYFEKANILHPPYTLLLPLSKQYLQTLKATRKMKLR